MTAVTRPQLSRELIARTALEMTDELGLAGLSMRKLGGALGVEAMSLYHYIDNKADLLDAILECLFAEIELAVDTPTDDWETAMRLGLSSFRSVLLGHRAAVELFATRPATGQRSVDVLRWSCARLEAVGLDVIQASHALHVAVSFVMGHVASEMGAMAMSRNPERPSLLHHDDPETVEFLRLTREIQPDELFASGLGAVIAGLRATYRLP